MCKKCDENDHESWADIKIQKNEKKDKAKKLYSQLLIDNGFIKKKAMINFAINYYQKNMPHIDYLCHACKNGECLMSPAQYFKSFKN